MRETKVTLSGGGRIVIPAAYRHALGMKEGDELILRVDEGELRLKTQDKAIRDAQSIVRRYVPKDRSLVDELIRERREELNNE